MNHFLIYQKKANTDTSSELEPMAYTDKHLEIVPGDRIWVVVGKATPDKVASTSFELAKTFVVSPPQMQQPANEYRGTDLKLLSKELNGLQWFEEFKANVLGPAHYSPQRLSDPVKKELCSLAGI